MATPESEHASIEDVLNGVNDVLNALQTVLLYLTNESKKILSNVETDVANTRLRVYRAEIRESRKASHQEED